MQKFTTSFLGRDCPGVVAAISCIFGDNGCNIEAMSQTMLGGEFAAIFIISAPDGLDQDQLDKIMTEGLAREGLDLSVIVRPATASQWTPGNNPEPFVVTVGGPDRPGLIGAMSRIFARHEVNIENLTALLGEFKNGNALFVFEVLAPDTVDMGRLRRELALEAQKLDLHVSVQHRNIFEAVNRVNSF